MISNRTVTPHRGYEVVAVTIAGVPTAQAFLGKKPASTERFTGSSLSDATATAVAWIDLQRGAAIAMRRAPEVATVEEYVLFFSTQPLPSFAKAILTAHYLAPERTMTAGELAAAAGWPDYSSANLHYGKLGDRIGHFLELNLPKRADGTRVGTAALAAEGSMPGSLEDKLFRWTMHPEVAEALEITSTV